MAFPLITSLVVDDGKHTVTTLHSESADVLIALRENYDESGELADVPDDEIIQSLIDTQGLIIYIEQHDISCLVPFKPGPYQPGSTGETDEQGRMIWRWS